MTKNEQGIDNCDETDFRSLAEPRDNTLNSSLNHILDSIADVNNTSTDSETRINPWHGSVTTSTDTLVPTRDLEYTNGYNNIGSSSRPTQNTSRSSSVASSNSSGGHQNNILPEVHCSANTRLTVGLIENNVNCMEESIQIRPEHHKLDISSSGSFPTTTTVNRRRRISSQSSTNSNKTTDFVNLKAVNGR